MTSVAKSEVSFTEKYLLFLYPFSWSVWAALFGMWMINAIAIGIIEGNLP